MKLDYPPGLAEFAHDVLKIFHVRTYYDWLARQDRFNRILAAHSIEAFADDHNGRRRIPILEFSGGIDQQYGGAILEIWF